MSIINFFWLCNYASQVAEKNETIKSNYEQNYFE